MTDETNDALARALALPQEADWSWKNYNPGLFQHMHALGVIAANYNSMEAELRFLLYIFLSTIPTKASAYLFERLSNEERLDLLKQLYDDEANSGTELADRLDWFVSGYGRCARNRNILMHSVPHGATLNALELGTALDLTKASRNNPGDQNFISVELNDLRRVADDIERFASFAYDLSLAVFAKTRGGGKIKFKGQEISPPLSDKPPELILLRFSPKQPTKDNPPARLMPEKN